MSSQRSSSSKRYAADFTCSGFAAYSDRSSGRPVGMDMNGTRMRSLRHLELMKNDNCKVVKREDLQAFALAVRVGVDSTLGLVERTSGRSNYHRPS